MLVMETMVVMEREELVALVKEARAEMPADSLHDCDFCLAELFIAVQHLIEAKRKANGTAQNETLAQPGNA